MGQGPLLPASAAAVSPAGHSITKPQLWPVFICYRQVDGLAAARQLHELIDKRTVTGPKGEVIQLDVYLDQTMPAVADWREIHRPYLKKARAFIVICTPGLAPAAVKRKPVSTPPSDTPPAAPKQLRDLVRASLLRRRA